jgi:tetratricopeptide (TPR) repeat protein
METTQRDQIPQHEHNYWNIGAENGAAFTRATAAAAWQEYLDQHKQGNWMQALKIINRLAAFDPQQPEIWRVKARLHGVMGHAACCQAAIETLLHLAPNDLDGLRMHALLLYCHQNFDKALSICNSVLAKDPAQAEFWILKADILKSSGKLQEAITACKRALHIRPDNEAAQRLQYSLAFAA